MIAHPFGIAGLIVNTVSAFGLLYFRPNPFANSTLTRDQLFSVARDHYERYIREMRLYRASVFGMAVGFVLQLIDLLVT